jgi:hypothetical protein
VAKESLDNIVAALTAVVRKAQTLMENQHLGLIWHQFEKADLKDKEGNQIELPEGVDPEKVRQPKTIPILVPSQDPNDDPNAKEIINLPIVTLAAPSSIRIANLKFEFEARLNAVGDGRGKTKEKRKALKSGDNAAQGADDESDADIMLDLGGGIFGRKKSTVKVTVEFEGTDPPEGLVRFNDSILKRVPS